MLPPEHAADREHDHHDDGRDHEQRPERGLEDGPEAEDGDQRDHKQQPEHAVLVPALAPVTRGALAGARSMCRAVIRLTGDVRAAPGRGTQGGMRLPVLIAMLLATLLLAACGDDDTPSAGDGATVAESVSDEARELAEQTRDLQEEVTETGRAVVEDPGARGERARERLEDQARRAGELADRARELPEAETARDNLAEANERTEEAARELRAFVDNNSEEALDRARAALQQGEQERRRAADDLLARAPDDARRALEEARENLPDLPDELPRP